MGKNGQRGVHASDLPLRLTLTMAGAGRFRYVLLRKDGTLAETSLPMFPTEDAARVAGLAVLRQRSLAAKLTSQSGEAGA
jgi:hypothetical protein